MSIQQEAELLVDAQAYSNPGQIYDVMAKLRQEQPVCWIEPEDEGLFS